MTRVYPVTPEIEEIFLEALDRFGEEREEYLQASCGEDTGLLREINRLLECAERAEAFFGEASTVMAHVAKRRLSGIEKLGDHIGPYLLVERIGEGGFGVVWRGAQTHPLKREVAIKVIKAGMDTREVLARFEGEREALSRMDHPNIARVLDAGETESGRPYVVMELVLGEHLTKFCDARQLPLRKRLELFLEVCRAVSHAHQKGVIHRDLKPSNVLVTNQEATVKVIDFGIAKAVEGRLTEQTLMTLGEQFLGTPASMSPEQMVGLGNIDTRTDIYALGALLYELLSGVTPFDPNEFSSRGVEGMRQMILETEPKRPSLRFQSLDEESQEWIASVRQTSPEELIRTLGTDLDWIVLKALEKQPERRYSTAEALAEDLGRYLADLPVQACPPRRSYLLKKFFKRHKTTVLLTLATLLVLLSATGVSLWQATRATRAEARATKSLHEAEAERDAKEKALGDSQAVSSLLIDLFRLPDPEANRRGITLARALQLAKGKVDEMEGLQPERKVLLQEALSQSYEGLGLYPEAITLRRNALKIRQKTLGASNPVTMDTLHSLGRLLFECGYYGEARKVAEEEVTDRLHAKEGDQSSKMLQARDLLRISSLRCGNDLDGSTKAPPQESFAPERSPVDVATERERERQRCLDLEQSLAGLRIGRQPDDHEVLRALERLAGEYASCLNYADAARIQKELVNHMKEKYGLEHHQTLACEEDLAFYLWRDKKFAESRVLRKEAIAIRRHIDGPENLEALQEESLLLADEVLMDGDRKAAIARYRELLPLLEKVMGPFNRTTLNAKTMLARALLSEERSSESLELLESCAPYMNDDTFINLTLASLELWFKQNDRYEQTRRRMLDFCIGIRGRMSERPDILQRSIMLCALSPFKTKSQGEEALKTLDRAQVISDAMLPLPSGFKGDARNFLRGLVLYRLGRDAEAVTAFDQVQQGNTGSGKLIAEAPLALLFRAVCLARLGRPVPDTGSLIANAEALLGKPTSQEEPLAGRKDGTDKLLKQWILLREASELLQAAPPSPSPTPSPSPQGSQGATVS